MKLLGKPNKSTKYSTKIHKIIGAIGIHQGGMAFELRYMENGVGGG